MRPVPRPDEPPQVVTLQTIPNHSHGGMMAPEQKSPVEQKAAQLGRDLRSIESLLGDDFDEAAEILVATRGYEGFDRARFKKVAAALSSVGHTIQGNPTKTTAAATADKYCRKPKPH